MNDGLNAVLLRAALPADAPTIVAITQAAYRANDEKTGGMYRYVFTETAAALAEQMALNDWRILILERDGEPVACVRISQTEPERINMWRLAVTPAAQGAGLGKLIIAAIEEWAAAWGRPFVTLGALEASPENRALYERLGYIEYGRREMGSMPGNFYTLLRKPITPRPNRTAVVYEQIAADYTARHPNVMEWHQQSLGEFAAALAAPARVLEVGCGPGRDAALLREAGYAVVALDQSWAMLQIASASGAPLLQGDSRALPVVANSVDGVWANASLLHLSRTQLVIALLEIRRVLRSDGVFYCSLKRGDGEGEQADGRWFAYYQPAEVQRALMGAGFTALHQWEHDDTRPGFHPWIMTVARAGSAVASVQQPTDDCGNPIEPTEERTV